MEDLTKAKMRKWLVGAVCEAAESPNGIPSLQFRSLQFGSFNLWIPSAWRITNQNRILISGDTDFDVLSKQLSTLLVGQKIQTLEVTGLFHDLDIQFESGVRLEVFSYLETYENWIVNGGANKMVIAGPSSDWSDFG